MGAVTIDARLEGDGRVYDLPPRKIILMTLKTEGASLLHQPDRFSRSRRFQMTQIARFVLERSVEVLSEERTLFGIMGIMTIDAVGFLYGVSEVNFLDVRAFRVMTRPAQRHRIVDQVARIIGSVGIVTCQTATFGGQRLMDASRIEIVPVMTAETHFGTVVLEQTGSFRSVRLVTADAVPLGKWGMNGRFFHQFLDLRVTRSAEFALVDLQEAFPVPRMRVVTVRTCAIGDRRMRPLQIHLLLNILVTGGTERVVFTLQQDRTGRGVGRVARRTHPNFERVVLVDGRQALHQFAMTIETEDLLITVQKVGES
jgi:hypothetical protein